jgi:hypothetical protein
MKTIVRKEKNVSLYIFPDEAPIITDGPYGFQVGMPAELLISDCKPDNAVVHENVTAPDDWVGCKYLFDGTTWTPNPDWVDPAASEVLDSVR